jgi:heme oxygenase
MNALNEEKYDALAALRNATKAQHALLDSCLPLSKDTPTLAIYQQHLIALRSWLEPMQDWLAMFQDGPQAQGFLENASRIALIDQDLADPCLLPTTWSARSPINRHPANPATAYRWGLCYVIEGSQLGGNVLYRRLGTALSPHPLRYLSSNNVAPGLRWAIFIAGLRQALHEPADIADACVGARAAFDGILAIHGLEAGQAA